MTESEKCSLRPARVCWSVYLCSFETAACSAIPNILGVCCPACFRGLGGTVWHGRRRGVALPSTCGHWSPPTRPLCLLACLQLPRQSHLRAMLHGACRGHGASQWARMGCRLYGNRGWLVGFGEYCRQGCWWRHGMLRRQKGRASSCGVTWLLARSGLRTTWLMWCTSRWFESGRDGICLQLQTKLQSFKICGCLQMTTQINCRYCHKIRHSLQLVN